MHCWIQLLRDDPILQWCNDEPLKLYKVFCFLREHVVIHGLMDIERQSHGRVSDQKLVSMIILALQNSERSVLGYLVTAHRDSIYNVLGKEQGGQTRGGGS